MTKIIRDEDLEHLGLALSELTRAVTKLASNAVDEVTKKKKPKSPSSVGDDSTEAQDPLDGLKFKG